jgi:hypothetical protein
MTYVYREVTPGIHHIATFEGHQVKPINEIKISTEHVDLV